MTATLAAVANHPNRGSRTRRGPTPAEVRAARDRAKLTQTEAADNVSASLRAWQAYEDDNNSDNARSMHPGLFELFLIKTGQPVPAWLKA